MPVRRGKPVSWSRVIRAFFLITFWLKFSAWVLSILNILIWRVPDAGMTGALSKAEILLFAHVVPGYNFVLMGILLIYLLGERPGIFFQACFLLSGSILSFMQSYLGFTKEEESMDLGVYATYISIVCFLIGTILLVDFIYHFLKRFGCIKKRASENRTS